MPNNKKNRKNKEKKAARATAAVGPTVADPQSLFECCHNPASCDKCSMAYPPGCLHSLREDERMSAEMNEIIPVYNRHYEEKDLAFWDLPANAPFANERTVRFFFYHAVKIIVCKDSLYGLGRTCDYKTLAKGEFFFMLHLYAVMKLGSDAAVQPAIEGDDIDMSSLDEGQVSIRALYRAFNEFDRCYYRLVYILNELSPCTCLEMEVKLSKEEAEAAGEEEQEKENSTLGWCSNEDCLIIEPSNADSFSYCAGCNIAQYCSRRCYKDHWRGDTTSNEPRHKIACKAIQELKSLLAGDSGGSSHGGAMGDLA